MKARKLIQSLVPEEVYWAVKQYAAADQSTLQDFTTSIFENYVKERRRGEEAGEVIDSVLKSMSTNKGSLTPH